MPRILPTFVQLFRDCRGGIDFLLEASHDSLQLCPRFPVQLKTRLGPYTTPASPHLFRSIGRCLLAETTVRAAHLMRYVMVVTSATENDHDTRTNLPHKQ